MVSDHFGLDVRRTGGEITPGDYKIINLVANVDTADQIVEETEAVLLDGPSNGVKFDWSLARSAAPKVIIAGGLDARNVAEAIRIARPWGVDASSRLETAPGLKDPEKVRDFIRAAKDAAAKQAA